MFYHANLNVPAFTKGKSQLDPVEIVKLLRQKYLILQSTLPTDFLMCDTSKDGNQDVPLIDRMTRVCAALVNLCPLIIPFD